MNNIETMEFSTANLERLAFYFKNGYVTTNS